MVAPVRERPPEVARAGRVDPRLVKALGWSFALHVLVVAGAIVFALYAPAPTMFEAPPGGPVVDLVTPRGDSKVFKVGPLAKAGGVKAAPKPEPPAPPKPEPPKAEPPKPPEPPKAEPPKPVTPPEPVKVEPPKPEPKPTAIPEPKKPEPKPEPKVEPKKPEPKPEPKKPEPKPEPKKPEPKPEPKAEPKKPEPEAKKPEPKAEPQVAAKPEPPKAVTPPVSAPPVVGDPNAGSSKPGVTSSGGGSSAEPGPSGDPNGGGGGAGNRSPEFYAYFGYMYRTIKEQWVWAGQDASLAATIRFSILADGSIADARITERSRLPLYDESALKAVRATGRLIPPPPTVRADFEDVELVFQAGDLME